MENNIVSICDYMNGELDAIDKYLIKLNYISSFMSGNNGQGKGQENSDDNPDNINTLPHKLGTVLDRIKIIRSNLQNNVQDLEAYLLPTTAENNPEPITNNFGKKNYN